MQDSSLVSSFEASWYINKTLCQVSSNYIVSRLCNKANTKKDAKRTRHTVLSRLYDENMCEFLYEKPGDRLSETLSVPIPRITASSKSTATAKKNHSYLAKLCVDKN